MLKNKIQNIFNFYDEGVLTYGEVFGFLIRDIKQENIEDIYQCLQKRKGWLQKFSTYVKDKNLDDMILFRSSGSMDKLNENQKQAIKSFIAKYL